MDLQELKKKVIRGEKLSIDLKKLKSFVDIFSERARKNKNLTRSGFCGKFSRIDLGQV
ncbi:hypothetical protein L0Y69_01105 [bacterium]|nr:hypothetical protein [bacterium]